MLKALNKQAAYGRWQPTEHALKQRQPPETSRHVEIVVQHISTFTA